MGKVLAVVIGGLFKGLCILTGIILFIPVAFLAFTGGSKGLRD